MMSAATGEAFTRAAKQRVLALVSDAYGGYGGIAQFNRDFLAALSACPQTEDILVIPRTGSAAAGQMPTKVRQLAPPRGRVGYAVRTLQKVRNGSEYDLIFCGHLHLAGLAQLAARRARVPCWVHLHGIEAWEEPRGHLRRAVESADLVTAVSRYTRQRVLAWANVRPDRIKILPNTFRADVFSEQATMGEGNRILERHGLQGRDVILTVSRIDVTDHYKGHDKVIRAMNEVRIRHPDAVYVIVGRGDNREALQRLAAEERVMDSVRFLGPLADEELRALYRAGRLFAMPSTREGFGIVFLEAAASGLPIIAGNRDGSVDALADGELGTLIDPGDTKGLVAAICEVLDRPRKSAVPEALARFASINFNAQVTRLVESIH